MSVVVTSESSRATHRALAGLSQADPPRTDHPPAKANSMELRSDSELLRALHDQHTRALWSYVVGLTNGDRGRAQDVVQETLLRAWRNPAVLEQTGGLGRRWLRTVAKRIVIDQWRTASRHQEVLTDQVPEQAWTTRRSGSWIGSSCGRRCELCRTQTGRCCSSVITAAHRWPRPPRRLVCRRARSNPAPTTRSTRYDRRSTEWEALRDATPTASSGRLCRKREPGRFAVHLMPSSAVSSCPRTGSCAE